MFSYLTFLVSLAGNMDVSLIINTFETQIGITKFCFVFTGIMLVTSNHKGLNSIQQ